MKLNKIHLLMKLFNKKIHNKILLMIILKKKILKNINLIKNKIRLNKWMIYKMILLNKMNNQ